MCVAGGSVTEILVAKGAIQKHAKRNKKADIHAPFLV